ncbi:hypothetical protein BDV3_001381 [Batrachochytrium dendrobatidis]
MQATASNPEPVLESTDIGSNVLPNTTTLETQLEESGTAISVVSSNLSESSHSSTTTTATLAASSWVTAHHPAASMNSSDSTDSLLATVRILAAAESSSIHQIPHQSESNRNSTNSATVMNGISGSSASHRPYAVASGQARGHLMGAVEPLEAVRHQSSMNSTSPFGGKHHTLKHSHVNSSHYNPSSLTTVAALVAAPEAIGTISASRLESTAIASTTTVLDLGDDDTVPVASWGTMASSRLVSMGPGGEDDDDEDHDGDASADKAGTQNAVVIRKVRRRKKRSPNRDDSDSEEEETAGSSGNSKSKRGKENEDTGDDQMDNEEDDPNYTPFDDEESIRAGFKVGFSEDRNKKYRRTMEDSHTITYNYLDEDGSGFFAVFDGHAGRSAADYCGQNLHTNFAQLLKEQPTASIPEILNNAFLLTDQQLSQRKGMHAGCTAVVGFIRTEHRSFLNNDQQGTRKVRVLYTANVGDSRAVLCRNGSAVRLSYDHKGSDQQESRRILDAGGFVMNSRVNGVLAVTRSLGDMSMKEWVIGNPYTTETELNNTDSFLILACDGIWDVCTDQQASDIIKGIHDPQEAADTLLDFALDNFSTDNLTVIVVRFNTSYLE